MDLYDVIFKYKTHAHTKMMLTKHFHVGLSSAIMSD